MDGVEKVVISNRGDGSCSADIGVVRREHGIKQCVIDNISNNNNNNNNGGNRVTRGNK